MFTVLQEKREAQRTLLFYKFLLLESVLESNCSVENEMIGRGVAAIGAEIAHAQELEAIADLCFAEHIFNLGSGKNFKGCTVHALDIILTLAVGIFVGEEIGIKANFGFCAVVGINPMDGCALDLASVSRVTATRIGVIGAEYFGNISVFILDAAGALDKISALQAAFGAIGIKTLIFGYGNFKEVFALDIAFAREAYKTVAGFGIIGIVFNLKHLGLAFGIVGDGKLDGAKNGHCALSVHIEILAEAMLEEAELDGAGNLGNADSLAEIANCGRSVAAAAKTAKGRHTGIIPAGNQIIFNKVTKLTLGHNGVVDAKTRKLDLTGLAGDGNVVHNPIIERTMVFILEGAKGMGYAFKSVLNRVGKVIHGEDAPFCALTVMLDILDAVNNGVAHIEVAACKIDLCAESIFALGELTVAHTGKKIKAFLDRTVSVGRGCRSSDITAVSFELFGAQLANIGKTLVDKLNGVFIILLKIVASVEETVAPIKTKPVDVFLNSVNILGVFLCRVGVIHTEVAKAAKFFGSTEIYAKSLAVTDVEIAVGLRGETGMNSLTLKASAGGKVFFYKLKDKVAA